MGHHGVFLTFEHITYGVEELLTFISDRASIESHRPPLPPAGSLAISTIVVREFPDGVAFQLDICSPRVRRMPEHLNAGTKTTKLGIEMHWYSVGPPFEDWHYPQGGEPGSELETCCVDASWSWRLDVSVCEKSYLWINPARNRDLRKVRSVLDHYAQPRVIIPPTDAAGFREDYIALIALFAVKAQCFAHRDEHLPRFFRCYCDALFRRNSAGKKLGEAEWHGVVDRVFERLYSGKVGMGFTMPASPSSFRAYVSRAIRGAASEAPGKRPRVLKPGQFPSSIDLAAASLGVSHMTVRRCISRLDFSEWTEQTWAVVRAEISDKKGWQEVTTRLQALGLGEEAARKRVQRWRGSGMTLNEALRRSAPSQYPRGTCTSCEEVDATGVLHNGKFLCGACYAEKTGFSSSNS
jgi:hypothetical protein